MITDIGAAVSEPINKMDAIIKIYPTVVDNSFTIDFNQLNEPCTITVLSAMGKVILHDKILGTNANQVMVKHLNAGAYIVQITTKDSLLKRQFFIKQ